MINYTRVITRLCLATATICPALFQIGCGDSTAVPPITTYEKFNLVSDTVSINGARIDVNLKNAWGISMGPTGNFWLASNHTGLTMIYDNNGIQKLAPVAIPSASGTSTGSPTGVVSNATTDFVIPGTGGASKFIYVSEDGVVSAWYSGATAVKVALSPNAVYKGVAIGSVGLNNYIYAADFRGRVIDVYAGNFARVSTMPFADATIPVDFAPFNIQNIDGLLYVTYAKIKAPEYVDDEPGAGNGYVNIFNTDGSFVKRFVTQGNLNSPWGIVKAPSNFGTYSSAILIGNFGDGAINAYDANGTLLGQLLDKSEHVISISGLWALYFITDPTFGDVNYLYFTAGPNDETNGVFGFMK